jgi:hypothetical protein
MKLQLRKGVLLWATLFLLVVFGEEAHCAVLDAQLRGERLTLNAEKAPLQEILLRLSGSGIRVQIDPQINPAITASFENRDLQKALESILKGLDHVLIWESSQGPSGPVPKLAEIQVFRPGRKDLMKPLRKASTLSIARNPKDGS